MAIAWLVVVTVGSLGVALLTYWVRSKKISPRIVRGFAWLSGLTLFVMVLSDIPGPAPRLWAKRSVFTSQWWSNHSVFTGVLSSLLMAGVIYFVYEFGEIQKADERARRQKELAEKVTGAGLGGIVDHMVDVEVGLAFVSSGCMPGEVASRWNPIDIDRDQVERARVAWGEWSKPGKPLRWLREGREWSLGDEVDPRHLDLSAKVSDPQAIDLLLDQCIRRILVAMREWTPLIGASEAGTEVLIVLSDMRTELMDIQSDLRVTPIDANQAWSALAERVLVLRSRARVLALCFENWSGAKQPRPELICSTARPWTRPTLGESEPGADFGARWQKALAQIEGANH